MMTGSHRTRITIWLLNLLTLLLNGANGLKNPTLNLRDGSIVLISPSDNSVPLEITCSGEKPLIWVIMDFLDGHYNTTETSDASGYKSTFYLKEPFSEDTGNYTCKYATGESVTSYIYLFDNETGFVRNQEIISLPVRTGEQIILDCRTTHPDIKVALEKNGKKDVTDSFEVDGFNIFKKQAKSIHETGLYTCKARAANFETDKSWVITIVPYVSLNKPSIERDKNSYYVVGNNYTIICSIPKKTGIELIWTCPNTCEKIVPATYKDGKYEYQTSKLIISNASSTDSGNYTCTARNDQNEKIDTKLIIFSDLKAPFVAVKDISEDYKNLYANESDQLMWVVNFRAYPEEKITYTFIGPSGNILNNGSSRIRTYFNYIEGNATLKIEPVTAADFGKYYFNLTIKNGEWDNSTVAAIISGIPKIEFTNLPEYFPSNTSVELNVSTLYYKYKNNMINYPAPDVDCNFATDCLNGINSCYEDYEMTIPTVTKKKFDIEVTNQYITSIKFLPNNSGKMRCEVKNNIGRNYTDTYIILSDIGGMVKFDLESTDRVGSSSSLKEPIILIEGDLSVKITCAAVNFIYNNVQLTLPSTSDPSSITDCSSPWSIGYCLEIMEVTIGINGTYVCSYEDQRNTKKHTITMEIEVTKMVKPELLPGSNVSIEGSTITVKEHDQFNISCLVKGTPTPKITWLKDDIDIEDTELIRNNRYDVILSDDRQTLWFKYPQKIHNGKYTCLAESRAGSLISEAVVEIETGTNTSILITTIFCVFFFICLLASIVYLVVKLKREKKFREQLRENQMYLFEKGNIGNLNPDCTVDEQADLLPYDNRYEVKKDSIKLGKLLGSGAFGRVMEAKVQDLDVNEKNTRVAVKMCKDETDKSQLQALTLELKIMIHMGKHLNIVNLMGAMTVNLDKGELWILVEYCRYGNMLRFLHKNKASFVNQIDPETGSIDPNRMSPLPMDPRIHSGKNSYSSKYGFMKSGRQQVRLNSVFSNPDTTSGSISRQGYFAGNPNYVTASFTRQSSENSTSGSISSPTMNNSFSHYVTASQFIPSGPSPSPTNHNRSDSTLSLDDSYHRTLATDMTVITSPNPLSPGSEAGEFSFDTDTEWIPGISGPITTTDLICWSWQMAIGMEYLAKRKVLHGDLAARNLLLAENNVIKISDFGLSRDIYKNDNYMKKSDGNMPIKWMSPEAIQEKIFSTQSDVWAFGITMWELFTLGNTPYPGIPLDPNFTRRLENGERMEKPKYADDEIYNVMLNCWKADPLERPDFTELCDTLSSMMTADRREDYVAMNTVLMDKNAEFMGSVEDYFNLMSSPDFAKFQPPQDRLDSSYIQMQTVLEKSNQEQFSAGYVSMNVVKNSPPPSASLFSPRPNLSEPVKDENVFDFSENVLSYTPDKTSSAETSKLLDKLEELPKESNSQPLVATSTPTATYNNNIQEDEFPDYNNIDLVCKKNMSKTTSVDSPTNKDEDILEIDDGQEDVYYINIKNMENSIKNYTDNSTNPDSTYINKNLV